MIHISPKKKRTTQPNGKTIQNLPQAAAATTSCRRQNRITPAGHPGTGTTERTHNTEHTTPAKNSDPPEKCSSPARILPGPCGILLFISVTEPIRTPARGEKNFNKKNPQKIPPPPRRRPLFRVSCFVSRDITRVWERYGHHLSNRRCT